MKKHYTKNRAYKSRVKARPKQRGWRAYNGHRRYMPKY